MNLDQARDVFIDESRELLEQMESILLSAEAGETDIDSLHALFRTAHTIKGSAGLFGLDAVVEFTHVVESVLDRLRNGSLAFDPALVGVLLRCRDHIAALVAATTGGDAIPEEAGRTLLAELQGYLGGGAVAAPSVAAESPVTASGGGPLGSDHWHLSLRFGESVLQHGMDPLAFINYLANYGRIVHLETVLDQLPAWEAYDPEKCHVGFEVDLKSDAGKEDIEGVFEFVRDDARIRILPPGSRVEEFIALIDALPEDKARLGDMLVAGGSLTRRELEEALAAQASERVAAPPEARPLGEILVGTGVVQPPVVAAALEKQKRVEEKKAGEARSIKIPADRLDYLIDLVGELVITGASCQLAAQHSGRADLVEANGSLLRLVEDIRDTALHLRMVPIGEVFSRFPRVVRDLSRELGKDIELQISGAEAELDKSMVEKIGDPLMHMVRNAIDHGIEAAAARTDRGKPARGTVRLGAHHEAGSIVIEVADDGGGLDSEKILAKAIEKGLVAEGESLSRQDIFRLILAPGFSTAARVTNLSGRGVGMDVVKSSIEALRGSLDIDSELGRGTTMRICLPLTLAIIDGFEVLVGKCHYILPLDSVVECIELSPEQTADYLGLRGEVLPIVRLQSLFEIEGPAASRQSVVVVRFGGQKAGVVVDRLLGERQTVIKPLGRLFEKVRGIAGSTILGSGEVALILDVPQVIAHAGRQEERRTLGTALR